MIIIKTNDTIHPTVRLFQHERTLRLQTPNSGPHGWSLCSLVEKDGKLYLDLIGDIDDPLIATNQGGQICVLS